ncbi:SNARE associated Golgi protein [Artemisia annua]|uniref:SNARE associated Golgi protein n=1 Tax=Artemisia annua TaxID=35608 RepID=A0A2U1NRF3_ARTAN|nr:SNARE associated Golgi protein [Artemisia annua]
MERLPEDCITHIISFGSPRDACRCMVLASIFKNAAESDVLWDKFFGSQLYPKIKRWLEKYPKKASIIRLAGEGDWYDQFRAVTLLRISPFPYVIYNYCAVATDVKFVPYLFGTLVGIVPEVFVAIYTGIMIRTLADASKEERSLAPLQIVFTVCGFILTIVTTIIVTVYAKKRLSELQKAEEEQQLLLLE